MYLSLQSSTFSCTKGNINIEQWILLKFENLTKFYLQPHPGMAENHEMENEYTQMSLACPASYFERIVMRCFCIWIYAD